MARLQLFRCRVQVLSRASVDVGARCDALSAGTAELEQAGATTMRPADARLDDRP